MKEKLSRTYSSWVTLHAWEHRLMCKKKQVACSALHSSSRDDRARAFVSYQHFSLLPVFSQSSLPFPIITKNSSETKRKLVNIAFQLSLLNYDVSGNKCRETIIVRMRNQKVVNILS